MGENYRVIQWATGNIGSRALQRIIEHPHMDLAALYVSSDEKVGQDAGSLCGLADTGILATNSLSDIVATDADCVLYMRQGIDVDEVCALLESGKNIVTTRGEFHHPASMDKALRERVEAACQKGGTSIYSTGSSPGFISEAFLIPLLAQARSLDLVTIDEFADCSSRNSPDMLFNIMGFGAEMGSANADHKTDHVRYGFAGTISQIADAIGLPIDDFIVLGEESAVTEDITIAAGIVPKGTMGAQRVTMTAMSGCRPVIRFRVNWYISDKIEHDWELRESGWRVLMEGDTPMKVDISFPIAEEEYPLVTPNFTAHRPINSVAAVCAAQPGIRTTADLPQIIPQLG